MTVYGRAKRGKRKKITTAYFILGIIVCLIIYVIFSYQQTKIQNNTTQKNDSSSEQKAILDKTIIEEKQEEKSNIVIPEKMGNYEVLGQLVIEKIDLIKNILNISENASLKLSIAKLYGPNLNESGNFCISGHNWNNMLKRLSEMQVGDTFYIINKEDKMKIEYTIDDMYTCMPEDLSCLDQKHDGKREVTLITCNPGGLTRLICKAHETERVQK